MESALGQILASGTDDWVWVAKIVNTSSSGGGKEDEDELRAFILKIVKQALDEGLVRVGDVGEDGFHAWALSTAAILRRIDTILQSPKSVRDLTSEFWLENTAKGDTVGEEFIRNELSRKVER